MRGPTATTRVFLVDDHEVVRRGVREMLEADGDVTVVGEAGTATDAYSLIPPAHPDVAVLDLRLPDGDGVEVCREIRSRHPEIRCVILTSYDDDRALASAVLAGAAGYVLKQVRGNDLLEIVRRVHRGETLVDPGTVRPLIDRFRGELDGDAELDDLTPQERRILTLIGEGLTNRQIGERTLLAEKTVKNYVSNLLVKLGMHRRTEAAALAARIEERRNRPWSSEPRPGESPVTAGR